MFTMEIFNEAFSIATIEGEVRERADPVEMEGGRLRQRPLRPDAGTADGVDRVIANLTLRL